MVNGFVFAPGGPSAWYPRMDGEQPTYFPWSVTIPSFNCPSDSPIPTRWGQHGTNTYAVSHGDQELGDAYRINLIEFDSNSSDVRSSLTPCRSLSLHKTTTIHVPFLSDPARAQGKSDPSAGKGKEHYPMCDDSAQSQESPNDYQPNYDKPLMTHEKSCCHLSADQSPCSP